MLTMTIDNGLKVIMLLWI